MSSVAALHKYKKELAKARRSTLEHQASISRRSAEEVQPETTDAHSPPQGQSGGNNDVPTTNLESITSESVVDQQNVARKYSGGDRPLPLPPVFLQRHSSRSNLYLRPPTRDFSDLRPQFFRSQVPSDLKQQQQQQQQQQAPVNTDPAYKSMLQVFYKSNPFQIGVAAMIVLNFLVNAAEAQFPYKFDRFFYIMEVIFTSVFTIELTINMVAFWWRPFFSKVGNYLDLVVVLISIIALALGETSGVTVLRLLRAFRVLRVFKRAKNLRKILKAIHEAIPGVVNAFAILLMVMMLYAILAVDFFGENHEELFGNFSKALFTMFQIVTTEGWAEIARYVMQESGDSYAVFFVSFIIIAHIILVNVVIAVLIEKVCIPDEYDEAEEDYLDEYWRRQYEDTELQQIGTPLLPGQSEEGESRRNHPGDAENSAADIRELDLDCDKSMSSLEMCDEDEEELEEEPEELPSEYRHDDANTKLQPISERKPRTDLRLSLPHSTRPSSRNAVGQPAAAAFIASSSTPSSTPTANTPGRPSPSTSSHLNHIHHRSSATTPSPSEAQPPTQQYPTTLASPSGPAVQESSKDMRRMWGTLLVAQKMTTALVPPTSGTQLQGNHHPPPRTKGKPKAGAKKKGGSGRESGESGSSVERMLMHLCSEVALLRQGLDDTKAAVQENTWRMDQMEIRLLQEMREKTSKTRARISEKTIVVESDDSVPSHVGQETLSPIASNSLGTHPLARVNAD